MKQLFHLCSTWQQQQWGEKRCIRLPVSVLVHWAASPAFSSAPVKLPWQQSERSGWGMAKRNVQWWSGRKLQKESIQWVPSLHGKNVYKSGMWPDPNNNLLRACLPRHNAAESKVRLSNMAAYVPNLFPFLTQPLFSTDERATLEFFFFPQPDLIVISLSLVWHCDAFSYLIRTSGTPGVPVMPEEQWFARKNETSTFFEKCDSCSDTSTPAWKFKWRSVFGSLLTKNKTKTKKKRLHCWRCNQFF